MTQPYVLAGTALPDWLSVINRRARLRSRRIEPILNDLIGLERELATGVLQHLHDDAWFHETAEFYQVSGQLTKAFRALLGPGDDHRPAFLGHITTELLLDAVLIERAPGGLEAYYAALGQVNPREIEAFVNRISLAPVSDFERFLPLFVRERFLFDYASDSALLTRLNQVLRRVKLFPLPAETVGVLSAARCLVTERADQLLIGLHRSTPQAAEDAVP